jgi:hypothetical protein
VADEQVWFLRVRLTDGSEHQLAIGDLTPTDAIDRFLRARDPFGGEWLETTEAVAILSSAVIVVSTVPESRPMVAFVG